MITLRNPQGAALTGSLYALLEGDVMGVISAIYDVVWNGIILQATIVTIAIMLSVLVLYSLGVLRATPTFVKIVVIGTAGIALLYLFALIMALFGVRSRLLGKADVGWHLLVPGYRCARDPQLRSRL